MLDKIRDIICEFVDIEPSEITEKTNLRTDLGLNSFDLVNIAVEIEREFGISVPDKKISGIKNIGDVMQLIAEN